MVHECPHCGGKFSDAVLSERAFCPVSEHGCTEEPVCPWPCKKLKDAARHGNKASSAPLGADLSAADSEPVAGTPPILTSRGLPNNHAAAAPAGMVLMPAELIERVRHQCYPSTKREIEAAMDKSIAGLT